MQFENLAEFIRCEISTLELNAELNGGLTSVQVAEEYKTELALCDKISNNGVMPALLTLEEATIIERLFDANIPVPDSDVQAYIDDAWAEWEQIRRSCLGIEKGNK